MNSRIIVIENIVTNGFFFTTDHCQFMNSDMWVPITFCIPHNVAPRKTIPDGIVKNKEDLLKVYYLGQDEIPNPDPNFQE